MSSQVPGNQKRLGNGAGTASTDKIHRRSIRLLQVVAVVALGVSLAGCVLHLGGDPGWMVDAVNDSSQSWLIRRYSSGGSDVVIVPPKTATGGLGASAEFEGVLQLLRPDCTVVASFPQFGRFDKATIRIAEDGTSTLDPSMAEGDELFTESNDCAVPAPS